VGSSLSDTVITEMLASRPISDAVPELVEQALRQAGPKSDNVTVLCRRMGVGRDATGQRGISTQALGDEVFASTIQASMLSAKDPRAPTSSTTPRSSARSARSTKPSSARRPSAAERRQPASPQCGPRRAAPSSLILTLQSFLP
jgi:hypothetical protein